MKVQTTVQLFMPNPIKQNYERQQMIDPPFSLLPSHQQQQRQHQYQNPASSRIDISIEHGTVLNPNATKHPPPFLTNALDSLASFPSMQRFQKRKLPTSAISTPSLSTTPSMISKNDQNANHLRSIHNRHSGNTRFIQIQRSPSANEEEMLKASVTLQAYPPNGQHPQQQHPQQLQYPPPSNQLQYRVDPKDRTKVGTTVASYLDTFHPEHYHQISASQNSSPSSNNGFVSKQRNFFTNQIATPISIDSSSSSSSQECDSEDGRNVTERKNDYLEKISKVSSSRRKSAPHGAAESGATVPAPKVTITSVTAIDPPNLMNAEIPASFYLLRQSQESLVLKKKPRATSENPSDRSPSYRTIIKFSKNREIIPDSSPDRPFPHAVLKHGEVITRSTPFVEKTSPQQNQNNQQQHQFRDSPTPDLLRVKFPVENGNCEPLSPSIIRQQCDEIYRIVQNHGYQIYSEGPESGYNTLKEAPPLTRMHSNGSSIGKSSPPVYGGGGLPPMQHPLQVDFSPPEPYKPSSNIHEIENKEAEIERLQRELYDAQVCNYRLNAQMGKLVSKDWKREESELKKSLKDKTAEIENLKKRLEKAERDRRNLESKQPPNVQALQGEKRELQIALEREESEKHELFMQINKLIAELADLRGNAADNAAAKELKQEIDQLRGKLQIAEHERDEIKRSISSLEAEKNAAKEELFLVNNELEKIKAAAESEKQKLRQEIELHQKEVQVKSAALQSLRLAKASEPSTSAEEFDRVVQEKNQLSQELENKKKELQELSRNENDKQKALEISEAKIKSMEKDLEEFRQKVESIQAELGQKSREIEEHKSQIHSSTTSASAKVHEIQEKFENAQKRISQLEESLERELKNNNEIEQAAAEIEERLAQAEDTIDELNKEIRRLQESGKSDELRINSELQMAKESIANRDKEIEVERKKTKEMEDLMKKLREEVDKHKNEIVTLNEDLQKRSSDISQSTSTIHELQTRISQLEKENNKLMEKASVEEELMTLVNSLQEARARISAKENEVHELRQKLNDQQDETDKVSSELRQTLSALERAEDECKKFAETDVELAEYRRESEKRLEELRRELNEEIVKAKSETNKLQNELESSKKIITKMENEIRDLVNLGESRLEKIRAVEIEKGRLETKIVEYESEIESAQEELSRLRQNQSEATQSAEKEVAKVREALKVAEKSIEANKAEMAKLEIELREAKSKEASYAEENSEAKVQIANLETSLSQIRTEKEKLEKGHKEVESEHVTYRKQSEDFKTLITSLEGKIAQIQSEKDKLESELREAESRHISYSKEGADFKSLINTLEATVSQLKTEKRELESDLAESRLKEAAHSKESENSKSQISNLESKISQIQSEKNQLEAELHEAQKKYHGTESSKDSEISKLKSELAEKDSQLQQLSNMALELDVVRSSMNEQHSKLGVMEQEKSLLADKLQEVKNALERKQEELEAEQNASLSKMGNREAELKQELERIKREKENAEIELNNQKELVADLKRSHDRLNQNLERFSELMAADGKRFDTVAKEKEILFQEKQILADNLRRTEERIKAYENEIEDLKAVNHTPPLGDEAELRRKIAELTEENARLAGDLLKQSGSDDSSQFRAEFEKALQEKQRNWSTEKQGLMQKLEEQENDIQKLHQSKVDLETDLQRLKLSFNDTLTPVPKPRRANTSLTNLTMDTYSERSITPSADEEEVRKLRTELDKQKRIVTVLRKKLQQQQVETLRQNKLNTSNTSPASTFH